MSAVLLAVLALAPWLAPLPASPPPIGVGPAYQLPSARGPSSLGMPVAGMRCEAAAGGKGSVHVEVFANRVTLLLTPGIGLPGTRREGAIARPGRCRYPLWTRDPTGLVRFRRAERLTLGDLFAVWGQPLSPRRVAGFADEPNGRVRLFVNGHPRAGDPRTLPLRHHDQIVLEVGGYVRPHATYRFPRGW